MSPEDRELLNALVEGQKAMAAVTGTLSDSLAQQMAHNAVLMAACGALYAELARASGTREDLDEMLARPTATIEANPDSLGHVLKAADEIRSYAESMYGYRP